MAKLSQKISSRLGAATVIVAAASFGVLMGSPQAIADPPVHRVILTMREFTFEPGVLHLNVGERVELHIRNQGAAEHEWSAGKGLVSSWYGEGFRTDLLAILKPQVSGTGVEVEGVQAGSLDPQEKFEGETIPRQSREVDVQPGGEAVLRFTVPSAAKGVWQMGCLLPGQAESGLYGTIRIG